VICSLKAQPVAWLPQYYIQQSPKLLYTDEEEELGFLTVFMPCLLLLALFHEICVSYGSIVLLECLFHLFFVLIDNTHEKSITIRRSGLSIVFLIAFTFLYCETRIMILLYANEINATMICFDCLLPTVLLRNLGYQLKVGQKSWFFTSCMMNLIMYWS